MFKSELNGLRAFAGDAAGEKLPSRLGPWHAIGVIRPDKDPPFNLGRDVIESAINSQGFQLFRIKAGKTSAKAAA